MDVNIISKLVEIVRERKVSPQPDSYTCKLFAKGENTIIKKLGEENAELIRALILNEKEEAAGEAADILYHMIVALEHKDVPFEAVMAVLEERFGKPGIRK